MCRFPRPDVGSPALETLANAVIARDLPAMQTWPINTYTAYYGSLAMFQVGGQRWQQWNAVVHDTLVNAQRQDGCQALAVGIGKEPNSRALILVVYCLQPIVA